MGDVESEISSPTRPIAAISLVVPPIRQDHPAARPHSGQYQPRPWRLGSSYLNLRFDDKFSSSRSSCGTTFIYPLGACSTDIHAHRAAQSGPSVDTGRSRLQRRTSKGQQQTLLPNVTSVFANNDRIKMCWDFLLGQGGVYSGNPRGGYQTAGSHPSYDFNVQASRLCTSHVLQKRGNASADPCKGKAPQVLPQRATKEGILICDHCPVFLTVAVCRQRQAGVSTNAVRNILSML